MNKKVLISVLAAIVASAGFYMVALKPKRQEASKLATKITEKITPR